MNGARTPGSVAVVETHISVLFFVGDRVYKVRKPVKFAFVDFEDREARRSDCEREVRLNRRLAPDVYLGVADLEMEGVPLDHMVVMRRMPEDRRLTNLLSHFPDDRSWVGPLAESLAAFHSAATRSPVISEEGTTSRLRARWAADFAECDAFVGSLLDSDQEAELRSLVERWLGGRSRLLDARIATGRICDGHGDLQADDIYCLDEGVRVLDCLEFSDILRYCDVIADTAFLVMDLERLGHGDAAADFLTAYQEAADDSACSSLIDHYIAARAYVRAKVACLRAVPGQDDAGAEARRLQGLALFHLRRAQVRLVLVGGLPGSGKSTVAAGIGAARRWPVVRSDELRRQLPAATSDGELFTGRYSPDATRQVYESMLDAAERSLVSGESVVLDASWTDGRWREAAAELAQRTQSELVTLCCVADDDVATRRIDERRGGSLGPIRGDPRGQRGAPTGDRPVAPDRVHRLLKCDSGRGRGHRSRHSLAARGRHPLVGPREPARADTPADNPSGLGNRNSCSGFRLIRWTGDTHLEDAIAVAGLHVIL